MIIFGHKIKKVKLRNYICKIVIYMRFTFIFSLILLFTALFACKKDKNFTKDHLDFSADTLLFDTVFTTVGSTTKRFKIYNKNFGNIKIEEVQLMGGEDSPFRINIDGVSGVKHSNLELAGNDSLFGFVEVTLDVNGGTYPMVISDSIRFLTNGLNQYLKLAVWGQDAYFHAPEPGENLVLVSDEIELWNNDKPHVLYGLVAVDSAQHLTIPQGTDIYCHKDSRLIIYKGSIDIQGELGNEVTFQGDRLESFYDDVTGQWFGIQLIGARESSINYAIIKNGAIGLGIYEVPSGNIRLTNTIIDNSNFFNLHLSDGGALYQVENCLFGDAGTSSAFLEQSTYFNMRHCNFVNYWSGSRNGPALAIRNWKQVDGDIQLVNVVDSRIDNCIIEGNGATEFVLDTLPFDGLTFDVTINSSAIKREEIYTYDNYTASVRWNIDPMFVDYFTRDFHLQPASPLVNAGDPLNTNGADIEGVGRGVPDIGLYEQ